MVKKNSHLFDGLMESLDQAREIAAGKHVAGARIQEYSINPARDFKPQDIKRIRKQLRFTQEMLGQFLEVSLGTVRSWEQGQSSPLGPSRRLLEGLDKCAGDLLGVYAKIEVLHLSESKKRTGSNG
jgi:DNA-binding transcriptional regulator YiaG